MTVTTKTPTCLEAAEYYASLGLHVFPVYPIGKGGRCSCGRQDCETPGKHPRTAHGLKDATTDLEQIRRWWGRRPKDNVGVATGEASGVLALDIDPRHGGNEAYADLLLDNEAIHSDTVEASTGSGGTHLLFKMPAENITIGTELDGRPGLDWRGSGGYIVAAPSNHVSGGFYSWKEGRGLHEAELAETPGWLVKLLLKPKALSGNGNGQPSEPPQGEEVDALLRWAGNYVNKVAGVHEGGRDKAAFSLAGHLLARQTESGHTLSRDQILSFLVSWNVRNGGDGLPLKTLEEKVDSALAGNGTPRPTEIIHPQEPLEDLLLNVKGKKAENGKPGSKKDWKDEPNMVFASAVKPEKVQWLWPARVPIGKMTIFCGDPGLGKSLLTLDVAARVSTGRAYPDGDETQPAGGVLIIAGEDDKADTIRPRLEETGADLERIAIMDGVKRSPTAVGTLNLSADLHVLEQAILSVPDCRLVIIDPLSAYLGKINSYKDAEVRGLLTPLFLMAARLKVAIICVVHLTKDKTSGPALYRAMGSIAFAAAARAAWAVIKDKDDSKRLLFLPVKNNLATDIGGLAFRIPQADVPSLDWELDPVFLDTDIALAVDATKEGGDSEAKKEAKEWLRGMLDDGHVDAKDLKKAAKDDGIAWITIKRVKREAGVRARKLGFASEGKWIWEMVPEQGET